MNFSQPAGEVAAMQRAIREGQVKGVADKDIAVRLVLADGSEYPLAGELLFSDLAVDPGTDTIAMRACSAIRIANCCPAATCRCAYSAR